MSSTSSRSRRHRRQQQQRRRRTQRAQPIAPGTAGSQLDAEEWMLDYRVDMLAAEQAEARGDASGAMEIMMRRPLCPDGSVFWRPWRLHSLVQLALLGDLLPAWVTSRWIADQAYASVRGGDERVRRAMAIAVDLRGGETSAGTSELDQQVQVLDRDWVCRQTYLYELGGLRDFLDEVVSSELRSRADRIDLWPAAPMGAFRLERRTPDTVTWCDLASGDTVAMPNTGSAVLLVPGEHVLARPVPVSGGVMFDGPPLPVEDEVARAVAAQPSAWQLALRAARARGRPAQTLCTPTGVTCDVPPDVWKCVIVMGGHGDDGSAPLAQAFSPAGLALSLMDVVRDLAAGQPTDDDGLDVWACLAAAVTDPGVLGVLGQLAEWEEPAERIAFLADRLSEPAAGLCRDLLLATPPWSAPHRSREADEEPDLDSEGEDAADEVSDDDGGSADLDEAEEGW